VASRRARRKLSTGTADDAISAHRELLDLRERLKYLAVQLLSIAVELMFFIVWVALVALGDWVLSKLPKPEGWEAVTMWVFRIGFVLPTFATVLVWTLRDLMNRYKQLALVFGSSRDPGLNRYRRREKDGQQNA
jgi:uncharacterized membrane protein YbhN (UPF0104 family)